MNQSTNFGRPSALAITMAIQGVDENFHRRDGAHRPRRGKSKTAETAAGRYFNLQKVRLVYEGLTGKKNVRNKGKAITSFDPETKDYVAPVGLPQILKRGVGTTGSKMKLKRGSIPQPQYQGERTRLPEPAMRTKGGRTSVQLARRMLGTKGE